LRIISDKDDPDERAELINMITASLRNLEGFVDSMYDYYKLNQGELEIEDINLEILAKHYQDIYGLTSKMSNVAFSITTNQTEIFRSDPSKLKIILNNLIENAFKYQQNNIENKFVKVNLAVTSEYAVITVADNGIGIEEQYQHSIFDMFYRATTHALGSGFGLYNTKDAITKLDGTLSVESKPYKGSLFTVKIPTK
jgi:signal transduction histidine kinase